MEKQPNWEQNGVLDAVQTMPDSIFRPELELKSRFAKEQQLMNYGNHKAYSPAEAAELLVIKSGANSLRRTEQPRPEAQPLMTVPNGYP